MRKMICFFMLVLVVSCRQSVTDTGHKFITVSIAPFKYFVEEIAGNDFKVNIMVPAGSDPHIYEPAPEQIIRLKNSVAYISNGYLGFEMTWLERFYETNRSMRRLSLGEKISPLGSDHQHDGEHVEAADPHYWVSPKCAMIMALSVKELLCQLNPLQKDKYETNYRSLELRISDLDKKAQELFAGCKNRSFMIYHPNLGYLARDYGLEEIPVEYEGKEPTPLRMKELIDRARKDRLKTIFVQREYDTKNAKAIASETGAVIKIIDPLSEDWMKATTDVINALHTSLIENTK
jgi:zinc transport system substrate-binding protein